MGAINITAFRCGHCGLSFPWKPQYAGRRIKCKCGHVTLAPTTPPPTGSEPDAPGADDLYGIAPDPAGPQPAIQHGQPAGPPAEPAPASPTRSTDDVLARLGLPPQRVSHLTEEMLAEDRQATARLLEDSPLRDIFAPVVLIATGLLLSFHELAGAGEQPTYAYAAAAPQVIMRTVLGAGLILGAAFLAVAFLDVTLLGPWRKSILKLCAIAIAPAAVQGLFVHAFGEMGGSVAGVLATVGLYTLLTWYLLRLNLRDTAMLVLLAWILLTAANYVAYQIEGAASGAWV